MKEEYKSKICFSCISKICNGKIVKSRSGNITIIKCEDYQKNKTDKNNNLKKYIEEMKLREYKK